MFFIVKVGSCKKKKLIVFIQENALIIKNLFHSCSSCSVTKAKKTLPIPIECKHFKEVFEINNSNLWKHYLYLDNEEDI